MRKKERGEHEEEEALCGRRRLSDFATTATPSPQAGDDDGDLFSREPGESDAQWIPPSLRHTRRISPTHRSIDDPSPNCS